MSSAPVRSPDQPPPPSPCTTSVSPLHKGTKVAGNYTEKGEYEYFYFLSILSKPTILLSISHFHSSTLFGGMHALMYLVFDSASGLPL